MTISLYLGLAFLGIALLSSLTLYLRSDNTLYLRLFPVFLIIITAPSIIIGYLYLKGKSNIIAYNFLFTFEFCFYFFVLGRIITNKKMKKLIFFVLLIYPLITACNIFLIQKITVFPTITYSIGCLLIVTFSIYYFSELFQLPNAVNLLRQPAFWICSGLLFYFTCNFFVSGLTNFLKTPSRSIVKNIAIISNLMDVLLYSSFTVAFLCRIKIRKSML
jgi:hypothetical protein